MNKKTIRITAVDLDGTLARCNTLKVYIRKGIHKLFRERKLSRLTYILVLIAARKLRFISHQTMKYRSIRLIDANKFFLESFASEVIGLFNNDVKLFIETRRSAGDHILLATAAAELYIPYIWAGDWIASSCNGPELRGAAKTEALKNWLNDNNAYINYFLTDHASDLPTAIYTEQQGGTTIIVSPTAKSQRIFASHGFVNIL